MPAHPWKVSSEACPDISKNRSNLKPSRRLPVMSNKKVLVVEDDADVRLGYHVLLKAHHYDTILAGDGVSAVSLALKQQPDLIILDLGLPAGDGFIVLEWFRTNP